MYCLRMVRVSLNTQTRGMYSFWYCPMMQCQSISGTRNTLTRGVVCMCLSWYRPGMVHSILRSWDTLTRGCFCMCSSWYCLVIVRASWDLSILREWVVVWTVSLIILAVSQDGQSISIFHTLTKSGWCGLHMCSSWCYLGTVRVSWELCSGMVQHILYLKNFLWHFLASLDICLVNTILLSVAEWSSPLTTGPWPPPCSNFSFTAINHHMAVLFGGVQPEHDAVDDVYIIDFQSMVR